MYEDITISQYYSAMYKNDRSVITEDQLRLVHGEYADTACLYDKEEFSKVSYIHYLNNRVNSVKLAIRLQREFFNNFDIPFISELKFFKKFGYTVYWNNDSEKFIESLRKVEKRELKYEDELESKVSELVKSRLAKNKKEVTEKQPEEQFIRTIIFLQKLSYVIDEDKTTMQKLALMIKQQNEDQLRYNK